VDGVASCEIARDRGLAGATLRVEYDNPLHDSRQLAQLDHIDNWITTGEHNLQ
jgi:hypothetical protein